MEENHVGRLLQASATLRDGGRTGLTLESPLNLRTRRAHAYRSRRAALLCETTVVVQSPGRCSHRCGRITLQGKVIWARAGEKGYHLKFYLHFISPLLPHYWCRIAALLSQTSRDHRCGRVTWQVLMRGTPLDHRCGRVAKLALERRRVQWHCPRAPTPEPGKGHRPKNRCFLKSEALAEARSMSKSLTCRYVFRVLHACGRGRVHRMSISVVFWDTSISSAKRRA